MRVAVTGSSGFIGSHITSNLLLKGHEVIGLVRPNLDNVRALADKLVGVESLCHCAWVGHPRQEIDSPQRNIYTSLVVAEAANLVGIDHVVFLSTGGGIQDTSYSRNKREVESLFTGFDFDLAVLRPTAVYGEGQDSSKGLGAVMTFLKAIVANKSVHILGSPYSGRDYLHVDDLVECVRLVIENKILGTFDLGGPEVITLLELVSIIESALSLTAKIQIENPTGVDPQIVCLNNKSITAATGWRPSRRVVDSISTLRRTI